MPTGSNFILGQLNTASDPTVLDVPQGRANGIVARYPGGVGVVGDQALASGLLGSGFRGVTGLSLNDVGVGVAGLGTRIGVVGDSAGAQSTGTRGNADFLGVMGTASKTITTKLVAGVHGDTSNGPSGLGVNGQSPLWGVRGMAGPVPGVLPTIRSVGVLGIGKVVAHGVIGMATMPGFAGAFFGNASVDGTLAVTGAKGAAVPFPDGSRRLLYSLESPESWFEDFGAARLVRGRATVKIDRGFRGVVRGAYHVFLTPEGDSRGLYVTRKSAGAFEVRESQGGRSGIPFSYRIVARRKDVRAARFEKITLPKMPRGADIPIESPEAPKPLNRRDVRARAAARPRKRARRRTRSR